MSTSAQIQGDWSDKTDPVTRNKTTKKACQEIMSTIIDIIHVLHYLSNQMYN